MGQQESAIVGGVVSGPSDDSVPFLSVPSLDRRCSGVFVASNMVLTARHCIDATRSPSRDAGFVCTKDGELVQDGSGRGVFVGDIAPADLKVALRADGSSDALGARFFYPESSVACRRDIALVLLDRAVPGASVARLGLSAKVKVGDAVSVLGWGDGGDGTPTSTRHRRDAVPVLDTGDVDRSERATPLETFVLGVSSCYGDSGGPARRHDDAVLGIDSRIAVGGCSRADTLNVFVGVRQVAPVLREAFRAAGAEPWLAGQSAPGYVAAGGACTIDVECASETCGVDEPALERRCLEPCLQGRCLAGRACVRMGETWTCPAGAADAGVTVPVPPPAGGPRPSAFNCAHAPTPETPGASCLAPLAMLACLLRKTRRRRLGSL